MEGGETGGNRNTNRLLLVTPEGVGHQLATTGKTRPRVGADPLVLPSSLESLGEEYFTEEQRKA